jgi:hypothetical protein
LLCVFARPGYTPNLQVRLIQESDLSARVANRLARAYGGRAMQVIAIAKEMDAERAALRAASKRSKQQQQGVVGDAGGNNGSGSAGGIDVGLNLDTTDDFMDDFERHQSLLVPGYPLIEAEVVFAVRHDWAVRPEDFIARRCRLAFLNKDAAIRCIPRVVQLMAKELHWDAARQKAEMARCVEYMRHFGGSKPTSTQTDSHMRLATHADLMDVYRKAKPVHAPGLTLNTLQLASEMLNHILTPEEADDCLQFARDNPDASSPSTTGNAAAGAEFISFDQFASWWNSERCNPALTQMKDSKMANVKDVQGGGAMFG